jgi:hypothetical protein
MLGVHYVAHWTNQGYAKVVSIPWLQKLSCYYSLFTTIIH